MNQQTGSPTGARSNSEVLGEILWLYSHSPLHKQLKLYEVEQFVLPAIKHSRYRIYKRNGMPIGYVGIARFSQAVEDNWLSGNYVLQPDDWVSGDRLWYLQFVVPFGDILEVRKKLWEEPELYRKPQWALRRNKNGPGVHVVKLGKYRVRGPKRPRSDTVDPAASQTQDAPQIQEHVEAQDETQDKAQFQPPDDSAQEEQTPSTIPPVELHRTPAPWTSRLTKWLSRPPKQP